MRISLGLEVGLWLQLFHDTAREGKEAFKGFEALAAGFELVFARN